MAATKNIFKLVAMFAALAVLCCGCAKADTKDSSYISVIEQASGEVSSTEETLGEQTPDTEVSSEETVSSQEEPSPEEPTEETPPEEAAPQKIEVIHAYFPYEAQSYDAGSSFVATVAARPDSSNVTATFNGQTIELDRQLYDGEPEFVNFSGKFTLPTGNNENLNLGKVEFHAEWNGLADTYYSPSITCLRDPQSDRTTVVEVIADSAETFNGDTVDDKSDPRFSPLPKGTVDYMVGGVLYDSESKKSYYQLRCGRRVYVDKPNPPGGQYQVTKIYVGELPDSNHISVNTTSVSGGHTYITFDTEWKAPFAVTVGPQQYNNPDARDFSVQSVTSQYVDIKFYYADVIDGNVILPENPLFYHAEAIPQAEGAVLRLHLKSTGAFYGWDAYYNSQGQLEFKFLNPKGATASNNKYGADLTGITVMLDAGHGGSDPGATGGGSTYESERNLNLTYKIKAELESIGATVVLTRTGDTDVSAESRCNMMRSKSPDLCVSIHHNAAARASADGADFYCFNAYSSAAVEKLFARTSPTGIYTQVSKGWHYFFMGRVTSCPMVLVENGYMTNPGDFSKICDDETNNQKAFYIVLGIADYFLSIK